MTDREKSHRLKRIITGLALVVSSLLAGAVLGMLWVKLFIPHKAMGWDGLSDILGGMMSGGFLGVLIGALFVTRMSVRAQWKGVFAAIVVTGLMLGAIVFIAPDHKAPLESIENK